MVVPLVLLLGAFGIVALLIVVGMRQRWNDGTRPGWEPGGFTEPQPPPRAYWVLTWLGIALLFLGPSMAILFRLPRIGVASFVAFAVIWVVRVALIPWRDAETRAQKIAGVTVPLALVLGIALSLLSKSFWWLLVGFIVFVGTWPVVRYLEQRRGRRSKTADPSSHT
jgi:hypothetical protein